MRNRRKDFFGMERITWLEETFQIYLVATAHLELRFCWKFNAGGQISV